jgi:hypothetical protein
MPQAFEGSVKYEATMRVDGDSVRAMPRIGEYDEVVLYVVSDFADAFVFEDPECRAC